MSIKLELPNAKYQPGNELVGTVILCLKDTIKARSVSVHLDGRAHTHWTEQESYTHKNQDGTTCTESRTVKYEATVIYASGQAVVWRESPAEPKLQPGSHRLPFRFILPETCAPSFEGKYGYIRYELKVNIDVKWKFDKSVRRSFTVAPLVDLNRLLNSVSVVPVVSSNWKKTGIVLFRHGTIGVKMRLPRNGFAPGETVVVAALIDNESSRPIIGATLRLVQSSRFIASRDGWCCTYVSGLTANHHCPHQKESSNYVATSDKIINVPPKSKAEVQLEIKVPMIVASFNQCPIITVDYHMELKIEAKGRVNNTVKTVNSVLIGTVPICAKEETAEYTVIPSAPFEDD